MLSGYKIFWTNEALTNLDGILKYLEENWTQKEIVAFVRKLDKRLDLISINPKLFPRSEHKKKVRKSVLTKHTVIYYVFEDDEVKVLTLFDPRQNPEKLKI
jgi:plasmid stabilization system protein ParE